MQEIIIDIFLIIVIVIIALKSSSHQIIDSCKAMVQVTTPLLFKLIPAVVHLGVLLRWFSPDSMSEVMILALDTCF